MKTLTIELPDSLSPEAEHDLKMELAGALYTKGLLSTGQAAQLVGISRREFIETMGRYGFSLFDTYTPADLDHDLATLRHYFGHERSDSTH
ncbi:UPF0175 family protein [Hymenobacter weizhouensis]|uniref:UPF0175 family protein n=1 Tax=Hymenobacter sp. YIM 151500-1 TaxID=2987689 RepID=UPI002225E6B1|nr:UPF0175 family protein [Hymenobacter sp. YIM 151500-1]UYZ63540.1 UPF0175 family protein [Hymenobacter sp. YIM 151500-1]